MDIISLVIVICTIILTVLALRDYFFKKKESETPKLNTKYLPEIMEEKPRKRIEKSQEDIEDEIPTKTYKTNGTQKMKKKEIDEMRSKIDEILEDEIMRISRKIRTGLTFSRLTHHLNNDTENTFQDLVIRKTLFRLYQEKKIRIKPKPNHFSDFKYASVIYTPYSLAWRD